MTEKALWKNVTNWYLDCIFCKTATYYPMLNFLLSSGKRTELVIKMSVRTYAIECFFQGPRLITWKPNKGSFSSNKDIKKKISWIIALLRYLLPEVIKLTILKQTFLSSSPLPPINWFPYTYFGPYPFIQLHIKKARTCSIILEYLCTLYLTLTALFTFCLLLVKREPPFPQHRPFMIPSLIKWK